MSPPHTRGARAGRRPSGIRIVRELPLELEPVTRDPFIDDHRPGPGVTTIHRRQRTLVRESLLRVPGEERA